MCIGVHVEDVRAARLRKLATEQHNSSTENSILKPRNEASPVNRSALASTDKQTVRRRLNDKREVSKGSTDETRTSGTDKRLEKSRLLNPSVKQTESCQPQLLNAAGRSLANTEVTAVSVRATTSENCSVTTTVEVSSVPCDPRMVADNFDAIDTAQASKESSTTSFQKPAGITLYIYILQNLLLSSEREISI